MQTMWPSACRLRACTDLITLTQKAPAPLQAATCARCRAELGEAGRMCRHCRMDDLWLAWELRLFRLDTRALVAGAHVSAEDALRQVRPGVAPWLVEGTSVGATRLVWSE